MALFDFLNFKKKEEKKSNSIPGYTPGQYSQSKIPGYTPGKTTTTTIPGYTPSTRTASKDIDSSAGLYNLAVKNGYQREADRILASQSGEKTKQIFSGGFISDALDTLSALQYGVVGMLKGKTFNEGVKTRQSFTDKDALGDKGIPGIVAGIALDIAFDPLTYIAPVTIVKKVPLLSKLVKGAKELAFGKAVTKTIEGTDKTFEAIEGGTKTGKYLASKLGWMWGADPIFRETFERGTKNVAISTQNVVEMAKGISKLAPETASKLLTKDETGRFIRVGLDALRKSLKPEEFEAVSNMYNKLDNLSREAMDLGLLSKEKGEPNLGEYIKNAYTEYEQAKNKGMFGFSKVGIKGIKKRVEGLTPEKMAELGQIDNPAYLLFKSSADLTRDVENAKMFKQIAEKFGTDVAQDGFTKLPEGVRLGTLAGKYVPNHMAEYLTDIINPSKDTLTKELVANFKFFKVIMNPGTHARNIVSNKILNYWKLGMNPLDPRVISSDAEAIKEIAKGVGKYSDEARPLGYNLDTFASAEMKGLLDSPEAMNALGKTGKTWQAVKKKLGDIYQAEENQAKLSAYIFNRKHKGLSAEEAWKAAESATFNYAQVTPFVRKLRESLFGFPFITFTVKSTPVVAETLAKAPQRISVIQKIKQGIENLSDIKETDKERELEPSWVKNGFYIKLPIKDKQGRSAYFDLTYILPFGDLMSGNFFEGGTSRETGLPESKVTTAAKKSPFFSLVSELSKNQDFYGNKIWRESDSTEKQLGDIMRHLTKTYAPPPVSDQIPGGYNEKGERQQRGIVGALGASEENQKRNLMQELLRLVGGKIQPIDADIQETYVEWNKKKALQNMLRERGVLEEFRRFYQPKE
jgi:hypothetical protein